MRDKKRLQQLIHEVIVDCCVREVHIETWLVKPYDVEQMLLEKLAPEELKLPAEKELSGEEALKTFVKLVPRFKDLIKLAEDCPRSAAITDVELDIVKCKAKMEILEWTDGWFLDGHYADQLEAKKEEIKKQLKALEKVVCTSQIA